MKTKTLLIIERDRLMQARSALQNSLKGLPEGSIRFEKNGDHFKWIRILPGEPRLYLRKSKEHLARDLALKKHLENNLGIIDQNLCILDQCISSFRDLIEAGSIYCAEHTRLLAPYFREKQEAFENWTAQAASQSTDHPEMLNVKTHANILVRSKSEAMIANELFANQIPFRYEQGVRIGEALLFPDFIIPSSKDPSRPVIWEHFGLMDLESYRVKAIGKLKIYLDAGYIPGQNLIITFETKNCPLDINLVSLLISYHFGFMWEMGMPAI